MRHRKFICTFLPCLKEYTFKKYIEKTTQAGPLPVKNWLEPQCTIPNWFEPSQCVKHQKYSKMYLNFQINAPILFFPLLCKQLL